MSADPNTSRLDIPDPHIATAHMKVSRAHWAVRQFGRASHETVLKVAEAVARAAHANAGHYADWAVRETGFGVVEHKKIKNELSSIALLDHYRDLDLCSPRVLPDEKMGELPKPAGGIFALTPATNPVATLYYKTLMAILSRNAIVFSPHPAARECSVDAAKTLAEAAEAAGAPRVSFNASNIPRCRWCKRSWRPTKSRLSWRRAADRWCALPIRPATRHWVWGRATRWPMSTRQPRWTRRPSGW